MNKFKIGSFERINLVTARKLFSLCEDIYVVPCKCSPESLFAGVVNKSKCSNLDSWVNAFIYYNCSSELGKDVFYYKKLN